MSRDPFVQMAADEVRTPCRLCGRPFTEEEYRAGVPVPVIGAVVWSDAAGRVVLGFRHPGCDEGEPPGFEAAVFMDQDALG